MDHIKKWLRKPNKQEVRRQLTGQTPGDGTSAEGSAARAQAGGPPALDTRDFQHGDASQSEPPPPVCRGCGLMEEPKLSPANHTPHTETGNRDDLLPLDPWSLLVEQGAAWPRPHSGERRRGLPHSLPSSPLPGRWVGPCLTPPLSRCWVEAALQRSKDAQRAKRCPPQEWEGLSSQRVMGWSHQEEAWRYCLLSPCVCLRCPSAPPYQEQEEVAGTTLLYPSLSHMTIS